MLPTKLRLERCANDLNHFQLKVPSGTFSIAEIAYRHRGLVLGLVPEGPNIFETIYIPNYVNIARPHSLLKLVHLHILVHEVQGKDIYFWHIPIKFISCMLHTLASCGVEAVWNVPRPLF